MRALAMRSPDEETIPQQDFPPDLADRLDRAFQALERGDSSQLQDLLDAGEPTDPPVDELLVELFQAGGPRQFAPLEKNAIPRHEIIEVIGCGGMGVVYKALHKELGRDVAIKVMLSGETSSKASRERFAWEARLAAQLNHPHIVRVLDSEELPSGERFYSMDLVEGRTLSEYLRDTKPDLRKTLELFCKLCDAVGHAHEKGVIHRDLKPGNVKIDHEGNPHILDFGLAKRSDYADSQEALKTRLAIPGQIEGTMPYLSPEQANAEQEKIDERSDVYALGVMLYEAVTGQRPHDSTGSKTEVLKSIQEDPPIPPSVYRPKMDRELEAVIIKALENDRSQRFQSASEFEESLRAYLNKRPLPIWRQRRLYVLRKWLRRHRASLGTAAIVVLAVSLVLHNLHLREQRQLFNRRASIPKIQWLLATGRIDNSHDAARAVFAECPIVPEACMVLAQAKYREGKQSDNHDLLIYATNILKQKEERWKWAFDSLLAEMTPYSKKSGDDSSAARIRMPAPSAESWYVASYATLDSTKALEYASNAGEHETNQQMARLVRERAAFLALRILEETPEPERESWAYEQALQAPRDIVRLGGNQVYWTLFQARIYTMQEKYDQALACYEQAEQYVKNRCEHADVCKYRAVTCLCREDYSGAIRSYSQAMSLDEGTWDAYKRATPYWATGNLDNAARDYRAFNMRLQQLSHSFPKLYLVLQELAQRHEAGGSAEQARALKSEATVVLNEARHNAHLSEAAPDKWLGKILDCLAGMLTPDELINAAQSGGNIEQICEACFYAAEVCRLNGDDASARKHYQACVDTRLVLDPDSQVFDPMNEYHLAKWRLSQLGPANP
ncbi:MAG: protein kinase [Phycisphaerales bacterium]|nr:MAG: protein kinase [Phycisphaerales bacterium]